MSSALILMIALASAPPLVVVTDQRVEVNGRVYFAPGTSTLAAQSDPLLDALAEALRKNPRFARVSIEGHTDSTGAAASNEPLSLARAAAVRAALIARGVDDDRLVARGFGGTVPIATNETEAGRSLNRRVEFVVGGKRPPPAKVTKAHNDVDARPPEHQSWRDAIVGLGLFKLWRVQSREASSAEVTFRDASQLELREDTLVIIYGATRTGARRFTSEAELERGTLRSHLDALAGQAVTVKTKSADTELSGDALVEAYGAGKDAPDTIVSNHRGKPARLRAKGGGETVVPIGFGSKVKAEASTPSEPRPLPEAPIFERPPPAQVATVGDAVVEATWRPVDGAARYRVEVRDGAGLLVATDTATAPTTTTQVRGLPSGSYRMTLATIDKDRFESGPGTAAGFVIARLEVDGARQGMRFLPGDAVRGPGGRPCTMAHSVIGAEITTIDCAGLAPIEVTLVWPELQKKKLELKTGQPREFAIPYRSAIALDALSVDSEGVSAQVLNVDERSIHLRAIAPRQGTHPVTLLRAGMPIAALNVVAERVPAASPVEENEQNILATTLFASAGAAWLVTAGLGVASAINKDADAKTTLFTAAGVTLVLGGLLAAGGVAATPE